MTIKQKQCLLAYLDYYSGAIDGDWGPLSQRATEAFQRDYQLTVDGDFGSATADRIREVIYNQEQPPQEATGEWWQPDPGQTERFWDDIEFFTREEFRCQCGGKYCNGFPAEPEEAMVRTVDEIRRRLGVPVSIVDAGGSGVRCPTHNANVGGAANSNHLYGKAADLHSDKSPREMHRVAEEVLGDTGELGLYDWGIHVAVNCRYSRFNG